VYTWSQMHVRCQRCQFAAEQHRHLMFVWHSEASQISTASSMHRHSASARNLQSSTSRLQQPTTRQTNTDWSRPTKYRQMLIADKCVKCWHNGFLIVRIMRKKYFFKSVSVTCKLCAMFSWFLQTLSS